jgi:hypothetical protein
MNKEEKKAYHKAYYQKHKDEMKKQAKENREANHERELVRGRERYKKNRDIMRAKAKAHRDKNIERYRKTAREYAKTHKRQSRSTKLKLNYGITIEKYEEMYKLQDGKCAICEIQLEILVVDHDHTTKAVRKLLCPKCNLALGYVNDNISILQNMINYLNLMSTGEK